MGLVFSKSSSSDSLVDQENLSRFHNAMECFILGYNKPAIINCCDEEAEFVVESIEEGEWGAECSRFYCIEHIGRYNTFEHARCSSLKLVRELIDSLESEGTITSNSHVPNKNTDLAPDSRDFLLRLQNLRDYLDYHRTCILALHALEGGDKTHSHFFQNYIQIMLAPLQTAKFQAKIAKHTNSLA